ncbi:hypothetical protein SCYAM73S_05795 [Streptomyces cyaneofuscatus]
MYKTSNSRLVATRKASVKKIKFKALDRSRNGKERGVRIIIDATDPFCPKTGAKRAGIGASATVEMTRGGSFHVTGKHRHPDHELYMYNYAGKKYKTKTILRDKMLDLRMPLRSRPASSRTSPPRADPPIAGCRPGGMIGAVFRCGKPPLEGRS